jgi:hypothetical protein
MATNSTSASGAPHCVRLACQLTSAEFPRRKETVIYSLQQQLVNRQELPNGFAYEFRGSDALMDELAEFVKTERQCSAFFEYKLSFGGEGAPAWLRLARPAGAKDFMGLEPGM